MVEEKSMKFISDEEWKIMGAEPNAELINEVLTRVYNSAVEAAIRKLPDVVSRMVASTTATQAMTKDFFARNKGFDEHKEIVAAVVQDVESLHPDSNYAEILKMAEVGIKEKISAISKMPKLPLDKPSEVNLSGNGVL